VLLGVQLSGVGDDEHTSSLDELARLAKTLGLEVVARVTQKRGALAHGTVVGEGKLRDLAAWTGGTGVVPSGATPRKKRGPVEDDDDSPPVETVETEARASVILVDHDITPSQARNLEKATSARVLDRSAVILEIFHRHARTREAKAQVEIARLAYLAPRLRDSGAGKDRQRGGIGGKGAGESAMELDRRKIRDRIAELRGELADLSREASTRRARRAAEPTVALVGYTNAGKSSLMRALTGSEVLIEDKLFATLDTTVRVLRPETRPRILVSDTVGFIKKLPHDLVASFRSTLDEAREADLLLHVADASDPALASQIEVTRQVLAEIGADAPSMLLLNKVDRLDGARPSELYAEHPEAMLLSAKRPADVATLRERIVGHFETEMEEGEVRIPWQHQRLVAEAHATCRVISETHDETGTTIRLRAPAEVLARLRTAAEE